MEKHYRKSGDEEDLCKNDTKVAEWRSKGAACASVSRHLGATRNCTQLAEKRLLLAVSHGSSSTIHSLNGRASNGRAHYDQDPKMRGCSSPKPKWCWSLFLMSMDLYTQNSCHKAKILIRTSTKAFCDVWCALWGRKEENCGKRGSGCFIMTMLQLIMPWEFGSFMPKIAFKKNTCLKKKKNKCNFIQNTTLDAILNIGKNCSSSRNLRLCHTLYNTNKKCLKCGYLQRG